MKKLLAIVELSRWKEHFPFVVPLTLLGSLVAVSGGGLLDKKLIFVVLANVVTVTYAFMLNDVEDALDDARDKKRKAKNPVASGRLTVTEAYTVLRITAIFSIFFYSLTNGLTLSIGVITLLLSHLYSWKRVRLKAYPVADIVSHALMLSGLLVATGFTTYGSEFREIWLIAIAASLFSVYGQIYNQLRDYELDRLSGLNNTAITLGIKRTNFLKNVTILFSVIAVTSAVYFKSFPYWLIIPVFLWAPVIFSYKVKEDRRGVASIDFTGSLQLQVTILFNIAIISWLMSILLLQLR